MFVVVVVVVVDVFVYSSQEDHHPLNCSKKDIMDIAADYKDFTSISCLDFLVLPHSSTKVIPLDVGCHLTVLFVCFCLLDGCLLFVKCMI